MEGSEGGTERKQEQENCYLPFPAFLNCFFLPNKPQAELKVLFPLCEHQGIGHGASARRLALPRPLPCLAAASGVKPLTQMLWASSASLSLQEGKTEAGGLAVWF